VSEKVERSPPNESRPQPGGGARKRYGGRRRDHSHWPRNSGASKRSRGAAKPAANSSGTARTCGEPSITISVSRATPMSATKRRALQRTAWCCIRRATTTRSIFIACTVFGRTISEGSRDADSRAAGEAAEVITLAATLCLSAGRYSFPHRISSNCPGKSCRSACVNCETIGRGERVVDFERDIVCQRIWG
jgi:hypothetical protein